MEVAQLVKQTAQTGLLGLAVLLFRCINSVDFLVRLIAVKVRKYVATETLRRLKTGPTTKDYSKCFADLISPFPTYFLLPYLIPALKYLPKAGIETDAEANHFTIRIKPCPEFNSLLSLTNVLTVFYSRWIWAVLVV